MSNESIRVLLADDHVMFREGVKALLKTTPDIDIVGEVANGASAVAEATRLKSHVVVLDLDMPGTDGTFALRELQKSNRDVRVLILTVHAEEDRLLPLLEAGAWGFLPKAASSHDLVDAIRTVASGKVYVRPSTARMLASALVPHIVCKTMRGRFKALGEREQAVVRMVAEGYSGVEIARQLCISTKTVHAYKQRIARKLKLKLGHRAEYVRFAVEAGILAG